MWQKLNKWAVFSQEITLFTIKQDVKEQELLPCRGIMNPYHSIYHSEESPKNVSYSAGVLLSPDFHAISELTGTHFQFQWDHSTDNRYSNILNLSTVISHLLPQPWKEKYFIILRTIKLIACFLQRPFPTWRRRSEAGLTFCWKSTLKVRFCCSRSKTLIFSFIHSSLRPCSTRENSKIRKQVTEAHKKL